MFMVDLAVPRDIEPEVGDIDSVYLYTVDDLNAVVEEGLEQRQEAARQAERLIAEALDDWQREIRGYRAVDSIRALRASCQDVSERELERARKAIKSGKSPDEALELLTRNLTNKFLHTPTVALRSAAEQGDLSLIESANRLFGIDDVEDSE
jgi:Glutamyl-tRNA reductase